MFRMNFLMDMAKGPSLNKIEHHDSYSTFEIEGQEVDCFIVWKTTKSFDEVFETNTGYVIAPEVCAADNFMYAMIYGVAGRKGYPIGIFYTLDLLHKK